MLESVPLIICFGIGRAREAADAIDIRLEVDSETVTAPNEPPKDSNNEIEPKIYKNTWNLNDISRIYVECRV